MFMRLSEKKQAAKEFAKYWEGKGYEKGESAPFWLSLLSKVLGVTDTERFIRFEERVKLDHTSFIDGWIPLTHVLIEQKGVNSDLRKKIRQSDGTELTPFQQAKRYSMELPYSERPRWIVTCNFKSFLIYDMENPNGEPQEVLLKDLHKEFYRLEFITELGNKHIEKEMEISLKAGDLVGKIYDEFSKQYVDITNPHSIQSLNKLCVRLVFCLYAEDAGIFGEKGMFHKYISYYEPRHQRKALIDLFKVLNTPYEDRDPYLDESLSIFPYVNGGMFADEDIEIPNITEELSRLILSNAADDFDWSEISPTIFGAVFESTLNPETRRAGGMHYTSIENIHKVIDPLFLDALNQEFEEIRYLKRDREKRLEQFQNKLGQLTFLDPACGSGNFLTETFISLRRLENKVIRLLNSGKQMLGFDTLSPIKVTIEQFYGIEINDFAVAVAKTALWIAESQMIEETSGIVHMNIDYLPLKSYSNIVEGNALIIDWNEVASSKRINYIMGNPPFLGARLMSQVQKQELMEITDNIEGNGNLDYVCGWYIKCAEYIKNTTIKCALVSTNSISQGEQVPILWTYLNSIGIVINFAYKTFVWNSEANDRAHVHCVIIGFSYIDNNDKKIYDGELIENVKNINGYLTNLPCVYIKNRNKPISEVPELLTGCQRLDNDNYMFELNEMLEFIKFEPESKKYFKRWYGADEFINSKERYCLWIGQATPEELRKMPHVMKLIENVRKYRLGSKRKQTQKYAQYPNKFYLEVIPADDFILIPVISSEKRRYIPIGFMNKEVLCSNQANMIINANIYHFGILTSNVHMIWMRTVAGRLKSDYRYSKDIVYNNFPWPKNNDRYKEKIRTTAQKILNARALYPEASLADLYDDLVMPSELRKAHQANDKAVMEAYGFDYNMSELEIVSKLMEMYKKLTD